MPSPESPKGPPPGFSKGIFDALSGAGNLVQIKSAGILGFALTMAGLLLSRTPPSARAQSLHFTGLVLVVGAAVCAGAAIFPMKLVYRSGVIFWGDIASYESAARYVESLARLDEAAVEREYSHTNYRLSTLLKFKYGLVRASVVLLLAGAALAGSGYLLG